MLEYIQKIKFSTFFLLACGAVVNNDKALTNLKDTVGKYVYSV